MDVYILNQSLDRLDIIDAIEERITKIKSLSICLISASYKDEIDNEVVSGVACAIEEFIREIEELLSLNNKGVR